MSELRFTVHGALCSNNRVTRNVGGKSLKSADAREDTRRVREIATVAATSQSWELPQAASVTITAFCCRKDVGNVEKVPCDALRGIGYRDDADLMELHVYRRWDREGERYEVVVRECEDQRPGRGKRKLGLPPNPTFPLRQSRIGDDLPDSGLVSFEQLEQMKRSGLV